MPRIIPTHFFQGVSETVLLAGSGESDLFTVDVERFHYVSVVVCYYKTDGSKGNGST